MHITSPFTWRILLIVTIFLSIFQRHWLQLRIEQGCIGKRSLQFILLLRQQSRPLHVYQIWVCRLLCRIWWRDVVIFLPPLWCIAKYHLKLYTLSVKIHPRWSFFCLFLCFSDQACTVVLSPVHYRALKVALGEKQPGGIWSRTYHSYHWMYVHRVCLHPPLLLRHQWVGGILDEYDNKTNNQGSNWDVKTGKK